jgi:FkbM family methyltransferase
MNALDLMERFLLNVDGIIHVGANVGQEREEYRKSGATTCLYIEPLSGVFRELEQNIAGLPGHIAIRAVCSDTSGQEVVMNIASNGGQSSSIFPLGEHAKMFPSVKYVGSETLISRTLDDIVTASAPDARFNLLVIDAQGADLKVLRGARGLLPKLDGVFVEVSEIPIYEGGCTIEEIIAFLREFNFTMKWMDIWRHRHGDAFFLREGERMLPAEDRPNIARDKPASQSSLSPWSHVADAQGGNNGQRTGGFGFHTDQEVDPWWQVDLGQSHDIHEIRLYNRLDGCSERASRLAIWVSVDGMQWRQIHDQAGRNFGGIDGRPLRVFPRYTSARFVRLQLRATDYLHLDEVEIY